MRRPRWIPPGNLPRGRGVNPAEIAKRSTKRTRKPAERVIEDGFGTAWPMCERADCELHVVRPGTARCYRCEEEEEDRGAR